MYRLSQTIARFSVGNAVLDEEHRLIFNAMARVPESRGEEELRFRLSEILSLAKAHFRREEHYMRLVGFPHLAAHALEHGRLLNTLRYYAIDTSEGFLDLIRPDLEDFLKSWLEDHVLTTDAAYKPYMIREAARLEELAQANRSFLRAPSVPAIQPRATALSRPFPDR